MSFNENDQQTLENDLLSFYSLKPHLKNEISLKLSLNEGVERMDDFYSNFNASSLNLGLSSDATTMNTVNNEEDEFSYLLLKQKFEENETTNNILEEENNKDFLLYPTSCSNNINEINKIGKNYFYEPRVIHLKQNLISFNSLEISESLLNQLKLNFEEERKATLSSFSSSKKLFIVNKDGKNSFFDDAKSLSGYNKESIFANYNYNSIKKVSSIKFLNILYYLLEIRNPEIYTIIRWVENGTCFEIANREKLEKNVLSFFFSHSKYSNFIRQLNIYGFKKKFPQSKERNATIYENKFFIKEKFNLISLIKRQVIDLNENKEKEKYSTVNSMKLSKHNQPNNSLAQKVCEKKNQIKKNCHKLRNKKNIISFLQKIIKWLDCLNKKMDNLETNIKNLEQNK